jgi:hypothetical protein
LVTTVLSPHPFVRFRNFLVASSSATLVLFPHGVLIAPARGATEDFSRTRWVKPGASIHAPARGATAYDENPCAARFSRAIFANVYFIVPLVRRPACQFRYFPNHIKGCKPPGEMVCALGRIVRYNHPVVCDRYDRFSRSRCTTDTRDCPEAVARRY